MHLRVLFLLIPALLAACSESTATPPPPVQRVDVVQPSMIDYQPERSFLAKVESLEDATLYSQVSGTLFSRHFEEGAVVEEGDLLFTLDERELQSAVKIARGNLEAARADHEVAKLNLERGRGLVQDGHISKARLDELTGIALRTSAQVARAEAELEAAEINLSFAAIHAPFEGHISDSRVSRGELVVASQTPLANLVSIDPVHVTFHVEETSRSALANGWSNLEAALSLHGGDYAHAGRISYVANRVNTAKGTLKVQAEFPNPDHVLRPGEHVTVRLRPRHSQSVMTIPEQAVHSLPQGDFAWIVDGEGQAQRIAITTGDRFDGKAVVLDGLRQDARVVVSGLQHLQEGSAVKVRMHE